MICVLHKFNYQWWINTDDWEKWHIVRYSEKKNIPTCIAWLDSHHNTSQNILAWYFTNEKILAHRLNEIKFRFGDALFLGRIKHMVSMQRFLFLPNITSYARRFELFLTHCQGISELKPAVVIYITMLSTGILRTNYGPFKIGFIYSVCKCRYVYTGNCWCQFVFFCPIWWF